MMKNKTIILTVVSVLLGCSHLSSVQTVDRQIAAASQCEQSSKYSPLFTVLENNQTQISVGFGDFASVLGLSSNDYKYQVIFKGSKQNRNAADELVQQGEVTARNQVVHVPVKKTGVYEFSLYQSENSPFWKQKVFSIAPTEHVLTEAQKKELAEKYAPVLSYHDQEKYFPVSLEYLTNQVEVDPELAQETFNLQKKDGPVLSFFRGPALKVSFPFQDLKKVLPYYGDKDAVLFSQQGPKGTLLQKRYGKNHRTVYYSIFENPKWKEIYINYHFFYSFDPKNGTDEHPAMAAHIFDRESMTVVLRAGSFTPLMVFYGAHLPSQTMAEISSSGEVLQKWDSGRVFVNWPDVQKMNGRVVPAIALGSHGVYPRSGNYAVLFQQFKMLKEPAGGQKILYPEIAQGFPESSTSFSYKLEDLKLDQVTSDCSNPHNLLSFSGYTVDVLGPANATFPPFTDREEDYFTYADPNAPMFEMNLNKK